MRRLPLHRLIWPLAFLLAMSAANWLWLKKPAGEEAKPGGSSLYYVLGASLGMAVAWKDSKRSHAQARY